MPDPLTNEYAARVMQEYYNFENQVLKIAVEQLATDGKVTITPELETLIGTFTTDANAQTLLSSVAFLTPEQVESWADPIEPIEVVSALVVDSHDTCMAVVVTVDPTRMMPTEPHGDAGVIMFREPDANPTGWVLEAFRDPGVLDC